MPAVTSYSTLHLRILVSFLALFLLLANGRMDSGDANAQLQGALNFVHTGSFGSSAPDPNPDIQSLFVQSPSGRYYEAHDIGNSLLMVPSAAIAVSLSKKLPHIELQGAAGVYSDPAIVVAKTLCSLTETVFSTIACYFFFLLFKLFLDSRASAALALLFLFDTYFAGYFRSCWDVVPACNASCILLYFLVQMSTEDKRRPSSPIWAAAWFGVACLFRYSLLPFFGLGVLFVFWRNRRSYRIPIYLLSIATFAIVVFPTLLFNHIRMGSFFKPATVSPQFANQNGFNTNLIPGVLGLLASPNRGLFVFSPILLLIFALPWCWKSLPQPIRSFLACFSPGVFLYYLLISRLRNWGAAGWGPRYLLPVLPIFFLAAAFALSVLWNRSRGPRIVALFLIIFSSAVSLPAIFVDYTDAIHSDPVAIDPSQHAPRQILDTWHSLATSLRGAPQPTAETHQQAAPALFPDLAATRVALLLRKKSPAAEILFVLVYLALFVTVGLYLARQLGKLPPHETATGSQTPNVLR